MKKLFSLILACLLCLAALPAFAEQSASAPAPRRRRRRSSGRPKNAPEGGAPAEDSEA